MYNRKDHYYKKAKAEGRASRASYKLEQIQARFRVIKKGDKVLDLGCAPGSWMEVTSEMVGDVGSVAGIDLLPLKIQLRKNMTYVQGDINDEKVLEKIGRPSFDVILSDMAPNTSGVIFRDSYLSFELSTKALEVAKNVLKNNGNFVCKIFQGGEVGDFRKEADKNFKKVVIYIPPATRESSKELYVVGIGFNRGP